MAIDFRQEIQGRFDIPARTAVIGFAADLRLLAKSLSQAAFIGIRMFKGEMVALADAQDKPRCVPLAGQQKGQEATEQKRKWAAGFFAHDSR